MQIDSSTLYLYVKGLNKLLISSQIRQIHQIDQKIFDLELFRPNSSPLHLIINLHTPPIFIFHLRIGTRSTSHHKHSA